jgi:hypothetical protein
MTTLVSNNAVARLRVEAEHARIGLTAEQQPQKSTRPNTHLRNLEVVATRDFPIAFNPSNERPLATDIRQQLKAAITDHRFNANDISMFLEVWCSRPGYRHRLNAGAHRINLDGTAAE